MFIQESQQSATDDNTHTPQPPLYTRWDPDSGTLEVVRGYRDTSTSEGKYIPRIWTEAPPEPHIVTYEGTRYGNRRRQTMVHNPSTGLFELKHSPVVSLTVSSVRRLRGTTHATKQSSSLTRTDSQLKQSTNKTSQTYPTPIQNTNIKPVKLLLYSS